MNYSALFLQLLPEAVLVITALVLLGVAMAIEAKTRRPIAMELAITISCVGIVGACAALNFGPTRAESASTLLVIDPLARVFKAVVMGLGLLAVLLPPARREIAQPGEFHALVLFALTGLLLTVGTDHLMFLFVALELASLSMYLLAGFSRSAKAAEAALKYFLFGGVSAAFFLFGLSLIYGFCHALTLPAIAAALSAGPLPPFAVVGLLMVVVGLGFKLAAAPFHYWAPDVYQGAPATSVALIAAASKAVGAVVLVRVLLTGFGEAAGSASWGLMQPGWSLWLGVLAAVSMVFGNVLALAQSSVRRLLAYSAVANTGYLLVALSANGGNAAGAALFYVVVYGLATFGALRALLHDTAFAAAGGGTAGFPDIPGGSAAVGGLRRQIHDVWCGDGRIHPPKHAGAHLAGGTGGGHERHFPLLLSDGAEAGVCQRGRCGRSGGTDHVSPLGAADSGSVAGGAGLVSGAVAQPADPGAAADAAVSGR